MNKWIVEKLNIQKHQREGYEIPSIKIGRLAVHNSYQRYGLGKFILRDAIERVIDIASLSGIKGIEVVAKSTTIADFYRKYGFLQLDDNQKILYLPVDTAVNAKF